jgi:hypothetical protein
MDSVPPPFEIRCPYLIGSLGRGNFDAESPALRANAASDCCEPNGRFNREREENSDFI